MNIMTLLIPVMVLLMVLPIIRAHTCRWELVGGGIPFYIGVSHTARGIILHITTRCLITDIILGIGEATIQAMVEAIIQAMVGVTIRATDIRPTGTGEPA